MDGGSASGKTATRSSSGSPTPPAGARGSITSGGSYSIVGEGLDASGKARFVSTQSASFSSGRVFGPLDITLRPKPSTVTVTWNGCPPGVVLPYQVTIYRPPASGTTLTDKVQATQESCQAGRATLQSIPPGTYVVEVDSRAVTPAVRGTQNVTVEAGEDAVVNVSVP